MIHISRHSARSAIACILPALLAGCATGGTGSETPLVTGLPAANVAASGETRPVGTANADAADDPAIWRNPANPAKSIIVGTDKKAGLYSYDMKGEVLSFVPAGQLNNVALHDGDHGILVAASDRTDPLNSHIALFRLYPDSGALSPLGKIASGPGEAYGLCLAPAPRIAMVGAPDAVAVYAAIKDGTVREVLVTHKDGKVEGRIGASWKIETQIEGCVIDPATGMLYVGEEMRGIWRLDPASPARTPELVASADGREIVADVEGLAIAADPDGRRFLIASSQGDNAYAVYALPDMKFLGRFRIQGGAIDGTSETDGIDIVTGDFGSGYPSGLFVAQDGANDMVDGQATQNFKLVSWAAIKAALGLDAP
ncbi:MAG: phytase [Blastomonas sp.]